MRILHVYRTYLPDPPGGLQEAIRQICLATGQYGFENTIFTLSPDPEPIALDRPEGRVLRCRSWAAPASCDIGGPAAFAEFRRLVSWADVIHYHFPWPFADLLHFILGLGKPCVMTYHSDVVGKGWFGRLYSQVKGHMLNSMDAVVSTSPAYIKSSPVLKKEIRSDRLHVIPLGISEDSYEPYRQEGRGINVHQRFGLPAGDYFLFIGVLRPYKGIDALIEAASISGLPVVIAGAGREESRLRQLAKPYNNISFLGAVSDSEKMALIQGCRALVLPSHLRSEAFGMVLVEASMCAKPMISCEIGTGTSFVNAHEETGFVVPPESPGELSAAMEALANNDDLTEQMGKAARYRYERLFSGEALGRSYTELYHKVLGE